MKMRTWTHGERPRQGGGPRSTIGVVVDNLVDGYQRILFESIAHSAREHGVNLLAFIGGRLPSAHFDLIGSENVQGLIVVGGTIAHQVGPEGLREFCRRFDLPVCSVGIAVKGIASIVPETSVGVAALMIHLMAEHGRRRIAFIRGLGEDGAKRYEAFATALEEFGVPLREELVVSGDYTKESAKQAIGVLCDERQVTFDAVVAANDYMALGAIEALEDRGYSVPNDVAVVGFDDIEDARNSVVPLTTVQQPIRELGRRAMQLLLRQLDGRPLSDPPPMICHPIKRRSCGCALESPFTRRPSNLAQQFATAQEALLARRELVLADMLRTAQGELGDVGYHWEERLFDGIVEELRGATGNPFLAANEELSRRVSRSSGDVSTWQRVLAALRHHVLDCIADATELRSTAENAFNDALLVSAAVVGREESRRRTGLERVLRASVLAGGALIHARMEQDLGPVLLEQLTTLGVSSCYLSLYEDGDRKQARLLLAFDQDLPVEQQTTSATFNARLLAPEDHLPNDRRFTYAVVPLEHDGESLGLGLFEYDQNEALVFEALQLQISAALHAALRAE